MQNDDENTIHVGFEVDTGHPVSIPIAHTVVAGQTDASGKTTTLEALASRLDSMIKRRYALVFRTKRGEQVFADGDYETLPPYLKQDINWRSVERLIESVLGEKNRFQRAWVQKSCRGANSYREVQANARRLMQAVKREMDRDQFMLIDSYFDLIIPEIERTKWADDLALEPGVNVVNLESLRLETQALVIASSIGYIAEHYRDTVIIIPEAWKFLPLQRKTPVTYPAELFIRQGATIGNWLWPDSQDITNLDASIRRSIHVWVLGVQREHNEISRTIKYVKSSGVKAPKTEQIAGLKRGEFYVCVGDRAIKTYVQPKWLPADAACDYAMTGSKIPMEEYKPTPKQPEKEAPMPVPDAVAAADDRVMAAFTDKLGEIIQTLKRIDRAVNDDDQADPPTPRNKMNPDRTLSVRSNANEATANAPRDDGREVLYQWILGRLREEQPTLLKVATTKPEIEVSIERRTINATEQTLLGRLARLYAKGHFKEARTPSALRTELKRHGPDANTANIGREMAKLTAWGFVTKENEGFVEVAGMKVNVKETR